MNGTGWVWERGTVSSGDDGAGGTHAVWFNQVPALAEAGYDVVTWDSRGFGNSSYRSGVLDSAAPAADLAAVLGHLGIDAPVHLVGQSMGGWYVTRFAITHPESVRSLALCDTIGSLFTDELRQVMSAFQAQEGLGRPGPVTADLDGLGIPVLVLAGSDDPIFPAASLERLVTQLASATWCEIPGGGHSPYFERPDAFNAALLGFLGG